VDYSAVFGLRRVPLSAAKAAARHFGRKDFLPATGQLVGFTLDTLPYQLKGDQGLVEGDGTETCWFNWTSGRANISRVAPLQNPGGGLPVFQRRSLDQS
jgi:hypothetical protein